VLHVLIIGNAAMHLFCQINNCAGFLFLPSLFKYWVICCISMALILRTIAGFLLTAFGLLVALPLAFSFAIFANFFLAAIWAALGFWLLAAGS